MAGKNEVLERLLAPLRGDGFTLPEGYVIPPKHEHDDTFITVRRATYRDKKIEIRTTNRIVIDGEAVRVHTTVHDDGTVHCHGFPQYSFPSAMDLARKLVDASDVEFPQNELGDGDDHKKKGA